MDERNNFMVDLFGVGDINIETKSPLQTDFKLFCGDALEQLKRLDDNSVNTCVTSPPYYQLRDYGVDGQIGLEETPKEYINKLVNIFREVRRVLRDDGTLWINIADSYSGSNKGRKADGSICDMKNSLISSTNQGQIGGTIFGGNIPEGTKPKDMIGIPWMLAFALRDDGWYLRQDIIWHKKSVMPESVTDRCTRAHEYIFLLSKKKDYYFDYRAIQEQSACVYDRRLGKGRLEYDGKRAKSKDGHTQNSMCGITEKRNKRDVWVCNTNHAVKGAHYATYPKELIAPCILAGCPEGGVVLDPFNGSGTTGIVAAEQRKNYIGIELNPEYIEITKNRVTIECDNAFISIN